MKFTNSKIGEILTFNHRSYVTIVYGVLVYYLIYDKNFAKNLIKNSSIYDDNLDFYSALVIVHELEYHSAMLISHGGLYWHKVFNSEPPDDFDKWLDNFSNKHFIKV